MAYKLITEPTLNLTFVTNPKIMKHYFLVIYVAFLAISPSFIQAQTPCSAPYQAQDLASLGNTLWLIGTSDEKGNGIFKYENNRWFFYPYTGATSIAVTSTNIPLVLDNNGNFILGGPNNVTVLF